jgi:hypothetical protein
LQDGGPEARQRLGGCVVVETGQEEAGLLPAWGEGGKARHEGENGPAVAGGESLARIRHHGPAAGVVEERRQASRGHWRRDEDCGVVERRQGRRQGRRPLPPRAVVPRAAPPIRRVDEAGAPRRARAADEGGRADPEPLHRLDPGARIVLADAGRDRRSGAHGAGAQRRVERGAAGHTLADARGRRDAVDRQVAQGEDRAHVTGPCRGASVG